MPISYPSSAIVLRNFATDASLAFVFSSAMAIHLTANRHDRPIERALREWSNRIADRQQ
jgi:hypothetical protein